MKDVKLFLFACTVFLFGSLKAQSLENALASSSAKPLGFNRSGELAHVWRKPLAQTQKNQKRFGLGASAIFGYSRKKIDNASNQITTNISSGGLLTGLYNITPRINANFGLGLSSITENDKLSTAGNPNYKRTKSGITGTLGVFYRFSPISGVKHSFDVNVGGTAIFVNGKSKSSTTVAGVTTSTEDDYKSTLIALGVKPEWFINDYLSIHTQVGVVFSIINTENSGFSEGGVNTHFFTTDNLLGQTGFSFYF